MCGIAGIIGAEGRRAEAAVIEKMARLMSHRGPDGDGFFFACTATGAASSGFAATDEAPGANLAFGHRRLSILELSDLGRQPMRSTDGKVAITFNGEIFNHLEIRAELARHGHVFRSRSDTETVIEAWRQWGADCVTRFNGMFAFAIWDAERRVVFLARDRCGIKPLYHWHRDGWFIFASEIKAILAHPAVGRGINHEALNEYFTFQNTLGEQTLFEGVRLLPPGCALMLDPATGRAEQWRYWDFSIEEDQALDEFETASGAVRERFIAAVERSLLSDVPVGSYLSGGMDSGSIVAVARKKLGRITTFTCGFDMSSVSGLELGFDERDAAEALAGQLKTEHVEMVLHSGDMEEVMSELIWHLEELRVGQCYPNYHVSRLAGKFVKVCLSGAGGDELFAGYPWRYYRGVRSANEAEYQQGYYQFWQRLVPDHEKAELFTPDVQRRIGGHSSFESFRQVLAGAGRPAETVEDFINASLYFEFKTFLHGLLIVEDKISMAHSLEVRLPFLDNHLIDLAARVPVRHKLRQLGELNSRVDENELAKNSRFQFRTNDGKVILRHAMSGLIPPGVTQRMKQGFSAPDASWFRGESIDYVVQTLCSRAARINELVNPAYVSRIVDEHREGKINHRLLIWSFLSLEWWLKRFF